MERRDLVEATLIGVSPIYKVFCLGQLVVMPLDTFNEDNDSLNEMLARFLQS